MERYFFHLHECGTLISDDEGRMLPGLDAVRREAIAAARDVMANEVRAGRLCVGCCIEVKNAASQVVLKVPFRDALSISGL